MRTAQEASTAGTTLLQRAIVKRQQRIAGLMRQVEDIDIEVQCIQITLDQRATGRGAS